MKITIVTDGLTDAQKLVLANLLALLAEVTNAETGASVLLAFDGLPAGTAAVRDLANCDAANRN